MSDIVGIVKTVCINTEKRGRVAWTKELFELNVPAFDLLTSRKLRILVGVVRKS